MRSHLQQRQAAAATEFYVGRIGAATAAAEAFGLRRRLLLARAKTGRTTPSARRVHPSFVRRGAFGRDIQSAASAETRVVGKLGLASRARIGTSRSARAYHR